MSENVLIYEKHDGVGVMRMNRPPALNAMNVPLLEGLIAAVEEARRDPAVRCVLLAGSGRAFCAGGDLKAMRTMGRDEFREYILLIQRLSAEMRRLAKPSVAAVNGYALGGGFELAIICDIRIASENAKFGLPDTPVGLNPTSGMTHILPRIVGMGWAKHLAFTVETIDARQAERIGLVTKVVPPGELEAAAMEMARGIAQHPPLGLRYIKLGFDLASDGDFHSALAFETEGECAEFDTEETQRKIREFGERKRQ